MVEEQCGISRPFHDAVKQTLDGPHASDHTFLRGLACSTACCSLRHNLIFTISSSGLASMSSFRLVVLDTLDILPCVDNAKGLCNTLS